jgi:hypothetical protein
MLNTQGIGLSDKFFRTLILINLSMVYFVLFCFQDTSISISADSLRDQVAKEIQSLKCQLERSQAALYALVSFVCLAGLEACVCLL